MRVPPSRLGQSQLVPGLVPGILTGAVLCRWGVGSQLVPDGVPGVGLVPGPRDQSGTSWDWGGVHGL